MSSKYENFQSVESIERKREEIRNAREILLKQAKAKYEKDEARKERAARQGEGTWMLDSVSQRILKEEKTLESSKKKKHKKEKKKKKKKHKERSSSSSDDDGDKWVEKKVVDDPGPDKNSTPVKGPQLQRESWMEMPIDMMPLTSRQDVLDVREREKKKAQEAAEELPGSHARELNPHWKNGGTGLPEEQKSSKHMMRGPTAGDGGLSWLRTALTRFKKQAQEEERDLEEVVAERWGSLKKLEKMIKAAEEKQNESSRDERSRDRRQNDSWKREGEERRERSYHGRTSDYRDSDRKGLFKRPSGSDEDDSYSRRKSSDSRKPEVKRNFKRPSGSDDDDDYPRRKSSKTSDSNSVRKQQFQRPDSDEDSSKPYFSKTSDSKKSERKQNFHRPDSDGDDDYSKRKHSDSRKSDRKQNFQRSDSDEDDDYSRRKSSKTSDSRKYERKQNFSRPDSDEDHYSKQKYSDSRESERKQRFKRPDSDDDDFSVRKSSDSRKSDRKYVYGSDGDDYSRDKGSSDRKSSPKRLFKKPSDHEKYSSSRESSKDHTRSSHRDERSRSPSEKSSYPKLSRHASDSVPRWKRKQSPPSKPHEVSRKDGSRDTVKRRTQSSSSDSSKDSSEDSESGGEADRDEPPAPRAPPRVMSEQELNDLAAQILRAEIMGDDDLVSSLQAKLKAAREVREASKSGESTLPDFSCHKPLHKKDVERKEGVAEEEKKVVVLTKTGRGNMVRPIVGEAEDGFGGGGKKRRKKKVTTHNVSGERTIYFDNDDKFDLKTLVEQEKSGTAEDQNSMFARLAGKSANDKDLDVDDMFIDRAAQKQNESAAFTKDRSAAIYEHKKIQSAMEKCHRCFEKIDKHLIIAIGTKSYLCLPAHRSLAEGHCLIVPMQHVSAATALDEDVWQEMQLFRKSLVQMFKAEDQDLVIMETVMHLKHFPHTALECVPLEREVGDLSPIYFKKAIQEVGPEWSDNKKLIDLSKRDVRRAIPKGFPYFSADFGLQGGFATVIEDEKTFPSYFGREIVGGMIDAEPTLWRKPHKENFEAQKQKVLEFEQKWRPFDWTQDS